MPTVLEGGSEAIGLRFGYVLEHIERRCLYDPIRPSLDGENASGKLALWGTISGSVDAGTGCKDPGTGERL